MKLIVIIPCYNEEKTLPLVINSIPKKISGIDKIETLVVDDGSTDKTAAVAKKLQVNHLVEHKINKGLAAAFVTGIEEALKKGADIIVNTDGDNQYPQAEIPRLIEPILSGKAEMVVADRQTDKIPHFSQTKKLLQKIGSWAVRIISHTETPDVVSGFRAYSKEAAMKLNIMTNFSYVTETIIQAGKKQIPIASVKISTNPKTRESRLFGSIWQHIKRTGSSIIRVYAVYEPLKFFTLIEIVFFLLGMFGFLRFLFFALQGNSSGHIQSLILSAVLVIISFQIFMLGVIADLIGISRKLLEDILYRLKKQNFDSQNH
jgi:glycosyltransferase involved in cell wall biosynthesis